MHETPELFDAQARITEVVDADTYRVRLKTWHNQWMQTEIRLSLVDTHEIYGTSKDTEEYKKGKEEERFVRAWLQEGREQWGGEWPFRVVSESHEAEDDFGRWLCDIHRRSDYGELNSALLAEFGDDIAYEP